MSDRDTCPQSPSGIHEYSDTMCAACLEYDCDWREPCPESFDGPHQPDDTLCTFCLNDPTPCLPD